MILKIIETTGTIIEALGIAVIAGGAVCAVIRSLIFILDINRQRKISFSDFRKDFGKAIILGLEFLVAGDIVKTVAVTPSFTSIGVLSAIVVIRTFLSFSLEIEMNGTLPWRKSSGAGKEN